MSYLPAILFILAACVVIAFGRLNVRRGKRLRHTGRKFFGWALLLLGVLLMIIGVLAW